MSPIPAVPDTWSTRHLPVLQSVVARYELDGEVTSHQVADDTGLSPGEVDRAARELREEGLIDPYFEGGGGFTVMAVSGDARRIVGAWPTPETFADKLLEAVERGLRAATTPDERSRWEKLRDGLTAAGHDVLVNASGSALGAAVTGGFG